MFASVNQRERERERVCVCVCLLFHPYSISSNFSSFHIFFFLQFLSYLSLYLPLPFIFLFHLVLFSFLPSLYSPSNPTHILQSHHSYFYLLLTSLFILRYNHSSFAGRRVQVFGVLLVWSRPRLPPLPPATLSR